MKARLPEGYNMKRGDMMRQVQKMQEDMANAQAEVEAAVFEAAAGGGGRGIRLIRSEDEIDDAIDRKTPFTDPTYANEFLLEKFGNLKKLCEWLYSTNTTKVDKNKQFVLW